MNYTITIVKSVHGGYEVHLDASGNKRYITLVNNSNGEHFISKHFNWQEGEDLFWKVARNVAESMHGWSDWVEMLEA